MPLLPYFLKVKGDFISPPVFRLCCGVSPGKGFPSYFSSIGFGSKLSICESPPFMNRKITCLALGLNFGSSIIQGAEVGLSALNANVSAMRLAKLSMPNPAPILQSASQRAIGLDLGM